MAEAAFKLDRALARTLSTYFGTEGPDGEIKKALDRCWAMPTPINLSLAEGQLRRAPAERLANIQRSIERGDLRR